LILENDDFFHESFTPFQKLVEQHLADDASIPEEIRKMLNVIKPEEQNAYFPVFDARSSRLKTQVDEFQMKFFLAKWDHYIDRILASFEMTNEDLHDREEEAK
jgi:hypothetical protein